MKGQTRGLDRRGWRQTTGPPLTLRALLSLPSMCARRVAFSRKDSPYSRRRDQARVNLSPPRSTQWQVGQPLSISLRITKVSSLPTACRLRHTVRQAKPWGQQTPTRKLSMVRAMGPLGVGTAGRAPKVELLRSGWFGWDPHPPQITSRIQVTNSHRSTTTLMGRCITQNNRCLPGLPLRQAGGCQESMRASGGGRIQQSGA